MDSLRWTAQRNGWLDNGWLGVGWLWLCDGQLLLGNEALDGLVMSQWTAWQ